MDIVASTPTRASMMPQVDTILTTDSYSPDLKAEVEMAIKPYIDSKERPTFSPA